MKREKDTIAELKERIAALPKGYVSVKQIGGKERFYLQWREGGKVKSKYIKATELNGLKGAIEERKILEKELERIELGLTGITYKFDSARWQMVAETETGYVYGGATAYYLKWEDEVIGEIDLFSRVRFSKPNYNPTVSFYTKGKDSWTRQELEEFLAQRIVSKDRRDIEKILFKLGLQEYDVMEIAARTKAINAKDLLWITENKEEKMQDAVSEVFSSVFFRKKDLQGDSVDSPEGYNIKRYGVYRGKYGIFKERISPLSSDVESELAVYGLAKLLEVPCCRCYRADKDRVFSVFEYDWTKEHIVHFRQILEADRRDNELLNLIGARPEYFVDFAKMIALDFITRQDDRHLSNIAVKISDKPKRGGAGESFYPLYDNGRSLFYEDPEETVLKAIGDVKKFATAFGPAGTYFDYVMDLKGMGVDFTKILNLKVSKAEVKSVLKEAGLTGYRLEGGAKWIWSCLEVLRDKG